MYALRELCACISLNRHSLAHPVRDTPSAERVTVNHDVVGSSPTGGAIPIPIFSGWVFVFSSSMANYMLKSVFPSEISKKFGKIFNSPVTVRFSVQLRC